MLMTKGNFRWESDTSKTDAGAALFQCKEGQWVLIGSLPKDHEKQFKITKL